MNLMMRYPPASFCHCEQHVIWVILTSYADISAYVKTTARIHVWCHDRHEYIHFSTPGMWDHIKTGLGSIKDAIVWIIMCFSPSHIRDKYRLLRSMTFKELMIAFLKLNFNIAFAILTFLFTIVWLVWWI